MGHWNVEFKCRCEFDYTMFLFSIPLHLFPSSKLSFQIKSWMHLFSCSKADISILYNIIWAKFKLHFYNITHSGQILIVVWAEFWLSYYLLPNIVYKCRLREQKRTQVARTMFDPLRLQTATTLTLNIIRHTFEFSSFTDNLVHSRGTLRYSLTLHMDVFASFCLSKQFALIFLLQMEYYLHTDAIRLFTSIHWM